MMKINKLEIENLLGIGHREIYLDPDLSVSILMGANGVGKSTILEILHSCLTENWYRLKNIRFDSLALLFSDGIIEINRDVDKNLIAKFQGEEVKLLGIHGDIITTLVSDGELIPLSCGHWSEKGKNNHLRKGEILRKYSPPEDEEYPNDLSLHLRAEHSHLVKADRAFDVYEFEDREYTRGGIHKKLKVQLTSEELLKTIKRAKETYGSQAQRVQSEVVKDLISGTLSPDTAVTHQDTETSFNQYKEYVGKLKDIGQTEDIIGDISLVTERVDAANVDWILNALLQRYNTLMEGSVLEVSEKASRLFEFLKKALPSKEFKIGKDSVEVVSNISGENIPLDKLSSGEQQLFILGYEILFACPSNSIVLIDEPELSMDPKMQADFAGFLDDTFNAISCRYVLATHSSLVIRGRRSSVQEISWS